jgi:hypothetical protein
MRKLWLVGLAVLVLSALVQAGDDPWKTRPFEKWTENDVAAVLLTSPWSKPGVQASGAWRPDGMTQASGSPTIPGSGRGPFKALWVMGRMFPQVLVQSTNMQIFQQRGEKAFESVAYLQTQRVKAKVSPSHVAFLKGPDGPTVTGAIFYFPKKDASGEPTIRPDEKEVDFYLQVGDAKLRTYFEPKKMVDSQGEDL